MKIQHEILKSVSTIEMAKLTTEVKETLAVGYSTTKHFSIIDLWKIERQKRAIRTRRY